MHFPLGKSQYNRKGFAAQFSDFFNDFNCQRCSGFNAAAVFVLADIEPFPEKLVNQAKKDPKKLQRKVSAAEKKFLEETSSHLSDRIQSKVMIKKNGHKGKIEINFKSKTEFERLVELLGSLK